MRQRGTKQGLPMPGINSSWISMMTNFLHVFILPDIHQTLAYHLPRAQPRNSISPARHRINRRNGEPDHFVKLLRIFDRDRRLSDPSSNIHHAWIHAPEAIVPAEAERQEPDTEDVCPRPRDGGCIIQLGLSISTRRRRGYSCL